MPPKKVVRKPPAQTAVAPQPPDAMTENEQPTGSEASLQDVESNPAPPPPQPKAAPPPPQPKAAPPPPQPKAAPPPPQPKAQPPQAPVQPPAPAPTRGPPKRGPPAGAKPPLKPPPPPPTADDEEQEPLEVFVSLTNINIYKVNLKEGTFDASYILKMRWSKDEQLRILGKNSDWKKSLEFTNKVSLEVLKETSYEKDGFSHLDLHLKGVLMGNFKNISDYPVDSHKLSLAFTSSEVGHDKLKFKQDEMSIGGVVINSNKNTISKEKQFEVGNIIEMKSSTVLVEREQFYTDEYQSEKTDEITKEFPTFKITIRIVRRVDNVEQVLAPMFRMILLGLAGMTSLCINYRHNSANRFIVIGLLLTVTSVLSTTRYHHGYLAKLGLAAFTFQFLCGLQTAGLFLIDQVFYEDWMPLNDSLWDRHTAWALGAAYIAGIGALFLAKIKPKHKSNKMKAGLIESDKPQEVQKYEEIEALIDLEQGMPDGDYGEE